MLKEGRLRVVTYNVHKCVGLDRRTRPARIAAVLRELDADVIALQEVVSVETPASREAHQARFIAEELGYEFRIGENRKHKGGAYGNVMLTRLAVAHCQNYDITWRWQERRGALRVDVKIDEDGGRVVHVFNIHLGTAYIERRHQGRKLVSESVLRDPQLSGPRVVMGDFNEWTHGLASRLLSEELCSADLSRHLRTRRTYPGPFPLVHLDHIYYDDSALKLERLALHRSRLALVASDHLPLVADFHLNAV